jgi:hypothetical protein
VPRGPGSRLLAQGSFRAATCPLGSSSCLLAQGSSEAATCPVGGLNMPRAIKVNKYPFAQCEVSSKALRDKSGGARLQGVQQAAH